MEKEKWDESNIPDQRNKVFIVTGPTSGLGFDTSRILAKKNAIIMHPGPMNRGVEIDGTLADDINRSVIQEQVEMGVAVRMAVMELLIKNQKNASNKV